MEIAFKCEHCGKRGEHICLPELAAGMQDSKILEAMWRVYLTMTDQAGRIGMPPIKYKQGARRVVEYIREDTYE